MHSFKQSYKATLTALELCSHEVADVKHNQIYVAYKPSSLLTTPYIFPAFSKWCIRTERYSTISDVSTALILEGTYLV